VDADVTIGAPVNHWQIAMSGTPLRRSVLDAEALDVTVMAAANGLPYDPSGATVEFAFLADWINPVGGDWHAGTWAVGLTGLHIAQCNPGPGGLALTVGSYYVWVRITDGALADSPIIQQPGKLIVQ
jgi:hypothetical protein